MSGANTEFVDIIKLNFESNSEQLERSLAALKGYVSTLIPQMEQLAILFASIGEKGKATTIKNFADGLIKAGNAAKFNKDNIDESIKSFHKLAQEVVYSESVFKSLRKELDTSKIKDYSKDLLKLQDNFESLKFSLKKLVETQERWTSGKHVRKANEFILNTLEKEEKEILKLQEAYRSLLKDKEAAIAENDVNALNKINRELKEQNKLIQDKIDNLRSIKKEYREVATNLKEIDRISWVKEVAKRAMAYASIYASIYGIIQVMKDAVKYISEVDLATKRLQAVLGITSFKAKNLEESFRALAKTFGGSLEEINKAALELGRAGIDPSQVKEATKVVVELAMITGDSYASATNALVTFKENYEDMIKVIYKGIDPIKILGNKIAYIANASRMSVEDISTFANYALATAKSIGFTVDMVGALAIAFNNAGNSASTVGTEIRRLSTILVSKKENIKNFFDSIGLNQEILVEKFRKGGKEAEEAFKIFLTRLKEVNDTDFNHLIGGLQVLDRQALTMARNTAPEVLNQFYKMKNVATDGLKEASVIAESYVNIWERFKNLLGDLALKFDEVVESGSKALESLLYLFSDEHTQKLMKLSKEYKELIDLKKYYESIHDNKRVEALNKEIALLEKKIQLENKLKEQVESVSKAYKTIQDIHNMHYRIADWVGSILEKDPIKGLNLIFSKKGERPFYGEKKEDLKIIREELLKIIATNKQLAKSLIENPMLNAKVKRELKSLIKDFDEINKKTEKTKGNFSAIKFVSDEQINNASHLLALINKQSKAFKLNETYVKHLNNVLDTFIKKQKNAIIEYLRTIKEVNNSLKEVLFKDIIKGNSIEIAFKLQEAITTGKLNNKKLTNEELAIIKKLYSFYQKIIKLEKMKAQLKSIENSGEQKIIHTKIKLIELLRKQIEYLKEYNKLLSNNPKTLPKAILATKQMFKSQEQKALNYAQSNGFRQTFTMLKDNNIKGAAEVLLKDMQNTTNQKELERLQQMYEYIRNLLTLKQELRSLENKQYQYQVNQENALLQLYNRKINYLRTYLHLMQQTGHIDNALAKINATKLNLVNQANKYSKSHSLGVFVNSNNIGTNIATIQQAMASTQDEKKLQALQKMLQYLLDIQNLEKMSADIEDKRAKFTKQLNFELQKTNKELNGINIWYQKQINNVDAWYQKQKEALKNLYTEGSAEYNKHIANLNKIKDQKIALIDKQLAQSVTSALQSGNLTQTYQKIFEMAAAKLEQSGDKIGAKVTSTLATHLNSLINIINVTLKTIFEDAYNKIRNKYQPTINNYQQSIYTKSLQTNAYNAFGQEGFAKGAQLQASVDNVLMLKTQNDMNYELSKKAKHYKQVTQTTLEALSLAAGAAAAVYFDGGAILDGINMAIKAQNWAEQLTGFKKFQQAYINGVENFKQSLRDLANQLIQLAGDVYKNIRTYRSIYDKFSGDNTYKLQKEKEALTKVKEIVGSLNVKSIKNYLTNLLQASNNFISNAVNKSQALKALANGIDNVTSIVKNSAGNYSDVLKAMNSQMKEAFNLVGDLVNNFHQGIKQINKYIDELNAKYFGNVKDITRTSQSDVISLIQKYKKGKVSANEVLNVAKQFEQYASFKQIRQLKSSLTSITQMSDTDYLKGILENLQNLNAVGLPKVNIKQLTAPQVSVKEAIDDTKNFLVKLLNSFNDVFTNPGSWLRDILNKIWNAILNISSSIFSITQTLVPFITNALGNFINISGKLFYYAIAKISSIISGLGNIISSVGNNIVRGLKDIIKTITQAAVGIIKGSLSILTNGLKNIGGTVFSITKNIVSSAGGIVHSIGKSAKHIFHSVKHTFGFAQGGYTGLGIGQKDQTGEVVAGVVHAGEWVAPKWMLNKYPDLFKWLEGGRRTGQLKIPQIITAPVISPPNINVEVQLKELKETNSILDDIRRLEEKMVRLLQKFDDEGIKCVT